MFELFNEVRKMMMENGIPHRVYEGDPSAQMSMKKVRFFGKKEPNILLCPKIMIPLIKLQMRLWNIIFCLK